MNKNYISALVFFYTILLTGYLRYQGHLFVLFIACLWIADYCRDIKIKLLFFDRLAGFCEKYRNAFITVLLSLHLVAGIAASAMDWVYPFSASKETAKFINDMQMNNMPIVGDVDYAVSAVAGYLNRKFYYLHGNRFGSFIVWDQKRNSINYEELIRKLKEMSARDKKGVLIICNYELGNTLMPVVKIRESNESIVVDEKFYLYIMK